MTNPPGRKSARAGFWGCVIKSCGLSRRRPPQRCVGRDALKVLAVLEELEKHGIKLIIQGGDTVEIDDNPLLKYLRRFTSHSSLEVVLASTTE